MRKIEINCEYYVKQYKTEASAITNFEKYIAKWDLRPEVSQDILYITHYHPNKERWTIITVLRERALGYIAEFANHGYKVIGA